MIYHEFEGTGNIGDEGGDNKCDSIELRNARVGIKNLQMTGKYANFVDDSNDFSDLCSNTAQWNQLSYSKIQQIKLNHICQKPKMPFKDTRHLIVVSGTPSVNIPLRITELEMAGKI